MSCVNLYYGLCAVWQSVYTGLLPAEKTGVCCGSISCPELPTSPHSIARVLLERRCCGKYLSFSCQVQYPVSCSFSCDTLPVPDQTYGAIWISFPFESICCQDTFIRSIDNYILKAHCQPFLIQICGLTDKTCRQISQTSDLPRWCWPNINNRPSKYTKLWGGSITNSLNKRINFQRWKTKGSKRSALWENDGQGNSKSKTWDIQIFWPSDRPWGENRYYFEKLNDKSPGPLQDWKSFQKWQIWINKWILWLQGMYNLGQKLFVGICHLISTDCPNWVSFWRCSRRPTLFFSLTTINLSSWTLEGGVLHKSRYDQWFNCVDLGKTSMKKKRFLLGIARIT